MIFEPNEKELLLKLITYEQSRLVVQDKDKENIDKIINVYEMIKMKIKRL